MHAHDKEQKIVRVWQYRLSKIWQKGPKSNNFKHNMTKRLQFVKYKAKA